MGYDETYKKTKNAFGVESEPILKVYYNRLDISKRVLDIGAGQGRNSLFLARNGFELDAIDPSSIGLETISKIAKKEKLSINTYQCSFDTFKPETDSYSGILIFGLIQILPWESIEFLIHKIKEWTNTGSLIFITAFSVQDSGFDKYSKIWKRAGKNSFTDEKGSFMTYLEEGEILNLFDDFKVIHHLEGLGPEHRHGYNSPVERHSRVEIVFSKK